MSPRSLAASALSFLLAGPWAALARAAEPALTAAARSLPPRDLALLVKSHYMVQSDGSIWPPDSLAPLTAGDIPFVLSRIRGGQRLKALLQIDLILSNSEGERNLTPAEREQIRKVARESWPLFPMVTRKKFRSYFSLEELEKMEQDPAPFDSSPPVDMRDPEVGEIPPVEVASAARPAPPPAPTAPAVPTAKPAPPVPAPAASVPAAAPAAAAAPAIIPAAAVAAAAAAGLSGLNIPGMHSYQLPGAAQSDAPPKPPVATATASPPAAPAAAPAAIAPAEKFAPTLSQLTQEEFEKFLMDAPYVRDVKAMLRLISDKAPPFARARALNAVVSSLPQVVVDSDRAGADPRGALLAETSSSGEKRYTIALSPGPLFVTRKKLWSKTVFMVPSSPGFYAELRLPPPNLQAARHDSLPVKQGPGDWGETRWYADGSSRGTYSFHEQAGTLLRLLLEIDAQRQGWDASPYAVALYGRTAEWMFFTALQTDLKDDRFLDPELRVTYKQWLDNPQEYRDHLVHTLSAVRDGRLDPARGAIPARLRWISENAATCDSALAGAPAERAAARRESAAKARLELQASGLYDSGPIEAASQADAAEAASAKPAPPTHDQCFAELKKESESIEQASVRIGEAAAAERRFRLERRAHAPNP